LLKKAVKQIARQHATFAAPPLADMLRMSKMASVGTGLNASEACAVQEPKDHSTVARPGRPNRLSEVIASFVFSLATYEMLVLYGIVHWGIMFRDTPDAPKPPEAVFTVLGHLSMLRLVFSVLAVVWGIWSFRGAPRWAAWAALGIAGLALFSNLVVT
jgi:hypothetical protein